LRFATGNRDLTNTCKLLRHDLTEWAGEFDRSQLLAMRDANGDVGRSENVDSEYARESIDDVLAANFARAQQALRAVEEFSKTIGRQLAVRAERLRYRVYDFEKAAMRTIDGRHRLDQAALYVLVDAGPADGQPSRLEQFRERITLLCQHGADVIQLRDKTLTDRQLIQFGQCLEQVCRPHDVISVINDRADIAIAVAAQGVHLGQDDMPIALARQIVGPQMLIGVSTHSIQQARDASASAADYIGVGPTFQSATKQFERFTGVELLSEVASEISTPSFAIGGINPQNVAEALSTGVRRVAISAAVQGSAEQVVSSLQQIRAVMKRNAHSV